MYFKQLTQKTKASEGLVSLPFWGIAAGVFYTR
jgi:hypothetical protein